MSPSIPFLALACVALASSAAALQVGHLNDATPSKTDWAAPILLAGEMPVHVTNITSHDLGSLQVLCVDIGTTGPSSALLARVPDLSAWVSAGGVLVYHDRSLSTAAFLPGGSSVTLSLGASGDVNVVTPGTLLTGGPGGQLDDATLDSWTATTSGFATNLPGAAVNLLANGETPTHSTAFIYPHGAGSVYYSAIPVDFYLAGLGPAETAAAMSTIYAPNLVAYAVHGGRIPRRQLLRRRRLRVPVRQWRIQRARVRQQLLGEWRRAVGLGVCQPRQLEPALRGDRARPGPAGAPLPGRQRRQWRRRGPVRRRPALRRHPGGAPRGRPRFSTRGGPVDGEHRSRWRGRCRSVADLSALVPRPRGQPLRHWLQHDQRPPDDLGPLRFSQRRSPPEGCIVDPSLPSVESCLDATSRIVGRGETRQDLSAPVVTESADGLKALVRER